MNEKWQWMVTLAWMMLVCVALYIWWSFGKLYWDRESEKRKCDFMLSIFLGPLAWIDWLAVREALIQSVCLLVLLVWERKRLFQKGKHIV